MRISNNSVNRSIWIGALALAIAIGGCSSSSSPSNGNDDPYVDWAVYEGDAGASHFSSLTQINRENVQDLEIAWTYPSDQESSDGFVPSIVDTIMYVVAAGNDLYAIHAATGEEIWRYPLPEGRGGDRGVLYWESDDGSDRRVYVNKGDYLHAIDALTGERITSFGVNGRTDIRQGIDRDTSDVRVTAWSPGSVYENHVILGSATGEDYGSAPGHLRAFDAVTGELTWVFHTIPHPGEEGYDTWEDPEAYTRAGGANAWGGFSLDIDRGILYAPLGSATYDFYAADRLGANLFANAIVALDAGNGELLWHYQTTHHDLWDWDLTATPTLLTVEHDGETIDAVALAAKTGFLFVFDRVTGEPLWEIEERPVSESDMPGEEAWPTQPFPTYPEPFAVQDFQPEDVNPYIPEAEQDSLREYVANTYNVGLYTPPTTAPTMQMPGNAGGANWGSTAADPEDGLFYVLAKNLPTVLELSQVLPGFSDPDADPRAMGHFVYEQNCQVCHLDNLGGQPPVMPSLVDVTDRLTEDQLEDIIEDGLGNMPGFGDLSNEAVSAVIAYLGDSENAPEPVDPGEPTDDAPLRFRTGYGYFGSSISWAIKPPWMNMTAYDLNSGEILWQTPVGDVEELVERGITDTGASSLRGGPSVTEGGLIFMAVDMTARAYDRDTGAEIWSYALPGEVEGIPAVYEIDGRQYVTFAPAGGGGDDAEPAYVTFALPRE